MTTSVGLVLATVMAALSALHVVWAFGGVTGKAAVIPSRNGVPVMRPGRRSTLAVAAGLALAAYVALATVTIAPWPIPGVPARIGCLVLALLFAARAIGEFRYVGFFKRVRGTEFAWWDTRVFSPLCITIAASYAFLWNAGRLPERRPRTSYRVDDDVTRISTVRGSARVAPELGRPHHDARSGV